MAGSSVRCPDGYYRQEERREPVQNGPPPGYRQDDRGGYGYGPGPEGFWRGAPSDIRAREDWLDDRIHRGIDAGTLDRNEAGRAMQGLRSIRVEDQRLRRRDGGRLNGRDQGYLQMRLDNLSQQIRWANETGPRRGY